MAEKHDGTAHMELTAREDIEAPLDEVFRAVSDFEAFERAVLRRGSDVARTDTLAVAGKGMCWDVTFDFRGRPRKADLEVVEFNVPDGLKVLGKSSGIEVVFSVELVALSRARTRLDIKADIQATNLPARLVLQPMKLAHASIQKRFRKRVAQFASKVEDNWQNQHSA